jgi:hypothetical protein
MWNNVFRVRLATLTRRARHATHHLEALEAGIYLIGCVYNFCVVHEELSSSRHIGSACTPAMAARLTDRVWSVPDVLTFRVAPVSLVEPKRREQPHKEQTRPHKRVSARPAPLRPLLRLRNGVLDAFTS